MKRFLSLILILILLTGCNRKDENLQRAMELRAHLQGASIKFTAEITADYGDQSYTFSMDCQSDAEGELTFTVTQPETLAGISGSISAVGGKLTFDDLALAFDAMAEGRLTPVSAPWVMMKALRSGYLTACAVEENLLHVSVDDSYEDDALRLEIWLDAEDIPVQGEIYWEGRRLLSIVVTNFEIL